MPIPYRPGVGLRTITITVFIYETTGHTRANDSNVLKNYKIKTMISKLDFIFPVTGGSAGSIFGVLTFGEMTNTAISAAIFAVVGGIIGWIVGKILKKLNK